MSTIRITATIRDHIVSGMLRHRFSADQLKIDEARAALDDLKSRRKASAYGLIYSEKEREELARRRSWFKCVSKVKVMIEDEDVTEFEFPEAMPVPYDHGKDYSASVAKIVKPDCEYLTLRAEEKVMKSEVDDAQRELDREQSALRTRAIAVIESVTTVKRLLEVWPEVQDFLPEENAGPQGGVPAVLVADLNSAFNLKAA
jgi:Nucleotide modification associated domain 5